ncbi:N-acyl homoserine lactonase family protein [Sphingomonas sanxanigenens]|nr:N-acyl homoserine lactonase family protein [Sphingomonas sanxanigenens]
MKRVMYALIGGAALCGVAAFSASGQSDRSKKEEASTADVQLWRLDCGAVRVNDLNAFSDVHAYPGRSRQLAASCYLIRHGADYMLWDAGIPEKLKGKPTSATDPISQTLTVTLPEQLARIDVKPEQIRLLGISHYHGDHIGQAPAFTSAKLLIGKGDLDTLKAGPQPRIDPAPLARWLTGGGEVEAVAGDKDVFGDGSVVMLSLPGHTPGHHGLLVRLRNKGAVLISGDAAHFNENLVNDGVPAFNTDRAQSLASLARLKGLATNMNATLVLQHEPEDIIKLPVFPASAN